ncbi:hypothetical protein [Mangrovimonas yunxiaonensis]|uniref:hypothetical protein n=1 Tax=Mangrovimonas yunxiaonensis TaxID=1197477 RepID=UPI000691C349|nr:hypothetical protein [Mangrovimonas yunxiaonensis]GGH48213.1 hypothetical protein GCM10011364_23610 [Mangrovimonas yunxiaonensis]
MNLKKIFTLDILETALRIWTAFYIFVYGMSKSTQFDGSKSVDISIRDATESDMMWAFFGTTKEYPLIIGALQIIGAFLLLFRKTKLIGAVLLTPIFLNIILIDIFYKIHPGALRNAIIFQSVLILIFINQRKRIKEIFKIMTLSNDKTISFGISLIKFLISVILAFLMFLIFNKYM